MNHSRLKILSYNIHKGVAFASRKNVLAAIKEGIRETKAELVFLQEVRGEKGEESPGNADPGVQAQFEFLADEVWPHYAYGKNAVYSTGHHGNAILSAFPITQWSNVDISTNPLEKRGLLHAEILIPEMEKALHCFCVHLNLSQRGRGKQLKQISRVIRERSETNMPFILAGDFNDWRYRATVQLSSLLNATEVFSSHQGAYAKSFPAFAPLLSLDRIYVAHLRVNETKVLSGHPWNKLSDHLALYAEVEFSR